MKRVISIEHTCPKCGSKLVTTSLFDVRLKNQARIQAELRGELPISQSRN